MCESCINADGCTNCEPTKTIFKCIDCGRGYGLNAIHKDSFVDDTLKLCDGCGDNWVCIKMVMINIIVLTVIKMMILIWMT